MHHVTSIELHDEPVFALGAHSGMVSALQTH